MHFLLYKYAVITIFACIVQICWILGFIYCSLLSSLVCMYVLMGECKRKIGEGNVMKEQCGFSVN